MMMFDTFDILVPELLPFPSAEVRGEQTAFAGEGPKSLFVGEVKMGCVVHARDAFTDVAAWTGSADRANWIVLLLNTDASAAAEHDHTWQAYLDAVLMTLTAHSVWRVTCESDCDQNPVEMVSLAPDEIVKRLDAHRAANRRPIAFCSEQPG